MTRIKRIMLGVMVSFGLMAPMLAPATVFAVDNDVIGGFCRGVENDPNATECSTDGQINENELITTVINFLSLIVGVVAVIMIIIGGLKYITSGGDSGNVTGAKNTILYAVIGIIIVVLAQIIVRFVVTQTADFVE